ncbi:MAG: hypothetical protein AABZ31_02755 [Bdellovibrionota bacterium]
MFRASPEYRYLSDVLGLQQFVRPEGVHGAGILVVADQKLSTGETELLKKMLGSIKIENYETVVTSSFSAMAGEIANARGVIFISANNSFTVQTNQPAVEIKDFYLMNSDEAHPSETMAYKKTAWAELQNFKKKING